METIQNLIEKNDDLTVLQMSVRGVFVFILAFLLIRISGRRSKRNFKGKCKGKTASEVVGSDSSANS